MQNGQLSWTPHIFYGMMQKVEHEIWEIDSVLLIAGSVPWFKVYVFNIRANAIFFEILFSF